VIPVCTTDCMPVDDIYNAISGVNLVVTVGDKGVASTTGRGLRQGLDFSGPGGGVRRVGLERLAGQQPDHPGRGGGSLPGLQESPLAHRLGREISLGSQGLEITAWTL